MILILEVSDAPCNECKYARQVHSHVESHGEVSEPVSEHNGILTTSLRSHSPRLA